MTIGTAFFTDNSVQSFSRIQEKISDLQGQISSGKNDPRPSVDPLRASQLSALSEQRAALDQYTQNAEDAAARLALVDRSIGDAATIARQLQDLALQGANDVLPPEGRTGLRIQVAELRDAMMEIANRTDPMGQPLFGGYSPSPAFVETHEGVSFNGDLGVPSLRVSETMQVDTSVNGADVFMSLPASGDLKGVFAVMDDLEASLSNPLGEAGTTVEAADRAQLSFLGDRKSQEIGLTLNGPLGSIDVKETYIDGVPGPFVDAINAQTQKTGITASVSEDGGSIVFETQGTITISNVTSERSGRGLAAHFAPMDANGQLLGTPKGVRAEEMSTSNVLERVQSMIGHFAESRAKAGAVAATLDSHQDALSVRDLQIQQAVAGLEDLDLAAAVTNLQQLLVNQQASQQTYVQISRTSLFDYLR